MTRTSQELYLKPEDRIKPGKIEIPEIKMNQYQKGVKDVRDEFSDDQLKLFYRDMTYIREFEQVLFDIKRTGAYQGIPRKYAGPAHLSTGQESTAVGQAYCLDENDFIFGTHRGHAEVIAKGLSESRRMSPKQLEEIMATVNEGQNKKVIDKNFKGTVNEVAEKFFIYGMMSEIIGKETGFARGLGNSMHAFFIPYGIYPNNAIVGGSGPVALGAALFKRINKKPGIVISNFGDGAVGCGPVWEAMNFAGMDQFHTLWEDEYKGGLPILFNCINNGYGMGGQTEGVTMSYGEVARIGAGMNKDAMHSERIDGLNIFAVIDATKRKKQLLLERKGPALLDVITYRHGGHSTTDAEMYRTKEEVEDWKRFDCINTYGAQLIEQGVATQAELDSYRESIRKDLLDIFKIVIDDEQSPYMDFSNDKYKLSRWVFSNGYKKSMDTSRTPEMVGKMEENSRMQKINKSIRFAKGVESKNIYQIRDGIFEAVFNKFYEDPTLISFGEDVSYFGTAYGVYKGMWESTPVHRLFTTPISESAIIGAAVGYGMCGGRCIPEIMYIDFFGRCGDEIFNQLAKWQAMTAGQVEMPVVLRTSVGSKYGAQHAQEWTSMCAQIPGLKVVYPVTPYDAKGLMNAALNGTDPVIYIESQSLYGEGELFHEGGVPKEYYEVKIGEPALRREGKDVTILTVGATLYRTMKAAEMLEAKGISAEVFDARSVIPFNFEPIIESVKKTGKIVFVSDACVKGSILNDFAQNISELAFDYLDAPPVVVGAANSISPIYELDKEYYPQPEWILEAINDRIMKIDGVVSTGRFTNKDKIENTKLGF